MTDDDLRARYEAAHVVIREAGTAAARRFREREGLAVEHKGLQDLVSVADRETEALIRARLAAFFPSDAILGEEGGGAEASRLWVVDPIDGTANFLRGIPFWSVALAFVAEDRTEFALTFDPVHDELFAARRGRGAFRNGRPIRTAARPLQLACVGFSHNFKAPPEAYLEAMRRLLAASVDHRRLGSAALTFAHVADGRLDGAIAFRTNAWDVLGGLLLIEEAGGRASPFFDGRPLLERRTVLAGAPDVVALLAGVDGVRLS
ncbi:MAG: inositol monophosphatase [Geminicoccaceae bacterium]|nr:inositol monophosphatase [Geminicoccaceae bacterium]